MGYVGNSVVQTTVLCDVTEVTYNTMMYNNLPAEATNFILTLLYLNIMSDPFSLNWITVHCY